MLITVHIRRGLHDMWNIDLRLGYFLPSFLVPINSYPPLIAGFLQNCLSQDSYDPHIDELLNTMLVAVNSILQIPLDRMQHKRDSMQWIGLELRLLASRMDDFASSRSKWQHINHTHNSKNDNIPLRIVRL